MPERLQKILSQWGIASRRQAEQMIQAGRVRVNSAIGYLGQKADPQVDDIEVDGHPLAARPPSITLLLHKPAGVVSTCTDPWGRPTVLDLLAADYPGDQGLHPVGRLDVESTGALLITNDGDLTYAFTHPRHHVPKTYRVWVEGHPSKAALRAWRSGVLLDGRLTLPAQVRVIERRLAQPHPQTCLEVVLMEGRNRQIRRVAEQLGYPVLNLHRSAIGPIKLQVAPNQPELPPGHYRRLRDPERCFVEQVLSLAPHPVPVNS